MAGDIMHKIIGRALQSGMQKKLRGGPQSLLPLSPGKGSGVPSMKGLTPQRRRGYVVPRQNPAMNPKGRK